MGFKSKGGQKVERIYLDNASTTFPKPPVVAEAVYRYLTEGGCNINRGSYQKAYQTEEQVYETRQALSDLFGGPGAQAVAFTRNVTESLNVLLKGFLRREIMCWSPPWNTMP